MRRTKFFMSVMVSALAAVAMCLSMSACGGNDNDDEIEGQKVSTRKGVHRLEISFSRNYTPREDLGMYFFAFKTMTDETDIFNANGDLMPKRNAQGIEVKKTESCKYYTANDCISFAVTMYIARNVGEKPLEVTVKGYINDKKTRERTFEIPEGKLCTIYMNTINEGADIFRPDDIF